MYNGTMEKPIDSKNLWCEKNLTLLQVRIFSVLLFLQIKPLNFFPWIFYNCTRF